MPFGSSQRTGHFAEIGIAKAAIREIELRRVEEIEYLGSELKPVSLRNRKIFEYGEIQIP